VSPTAPRTLQLTLSGIRFRPLAESLADTYRWLSESGRVSRRQAGALAR
jgi:hypothetical protein